MLIFAPNLSRSNTMSPVGLGQATVFDGVPAPPKGAKQLDGSRCHLVWRRALAQATLLDGDPAHSHTKGTAPHFLAHVYCGQTAGRIKMQLGMQIGLGPGHRWDPARAEAYLPTKWHHDPPSHLARHGPNPAKKWRLCPFWGGAGSPSNTRLHNVAWNRPT